MTTRRNALTPRQKTRLMLGVSVGLAVLLYAVPYGVFLAYPLLLLSTLVHEMGHGVAAILVGGTFHRFQMWADGSGVATWSGEISRLDLAVVAAGGLVGPAVAAAIGFAFGRTAKGARGCLWAFGLSLVLALLLVVRNPFGIAFVTVVAAGCLLVAAKASREIAQLVLVFLAVQLALSVFSRGDYLFVPEAKTAQGVMPSDVGQMASALWLPYWFWGALCGAFSVAVVAYGVKVYWGR